MKYYLSSYKIGNEPKRLKKMLPKMARIGYVPNAFDYAEPKVRKERNKVGIEEISGLGIDVEMLDLKRYFGKEAALKKKIDSLNGIWVRGGNTFVLRQAMRLSGLDNILKKICRKDFLYGGYSAGACVLSPSLRYLQIADDPTITPYKSKEVIWTGLGLIDYAFLPHYKSDNPESVAIDKEVEYCKKNNIPFKTVRDGEVIIIE
jgi:dipeptidase E